MFAAFLILNVADIVTTTYGVTVYGPEIEFNPIASAVIGIDIIVFIAMKLILVTIAAYVVFIIEHESSHIMHAIVTGIRWTIVVMYLLIVASNLYALSVIIR